jgi:hypothetical protein
MVIVESQAKAFPELLANCTAYGEIHGKAPEFDLTLSTVQMVDPVALTSTNL